MKSPESPSALLDRYIETDKPFAVIKKENTNEAFILSGDVQSLQNLDEIPRQTRKTPGEFRYDTISMIPYAQARERGMEVYPDETMIRCMQIAEQTRCSMQELLQSLPQEEMAFDRQPAFEKSEEEIAGKVRSIIEEQIERGNACNVVFSAKLSAEIAQMSPQKALTVFGNLLRQEFGAYMTFFFYDGESYHIGASPERHITVNNGEVTMNPISGTYRKTNFLIDPKALEEFLRDPKEINELFMCVDEEIKQMAQMCEEGGQIVGPMLKEMSGLIHTEYLLVGKSERDCIDLLRESMHAPTVTGSPAESAFTIIKETEKEPRGYYASELVLLGHHPDGTEFLDSAITIRTMQIMKNGLVAMRVGASIVRDSSDIGEAKEIGAKGGGAIRALTGAKNVSHGPELPNVMTPALEKILQDRNATMNGFLFESQTDQNRTIDELKGKTVTIIDFEDQFSFVLKHMITAMGAHAEVKRFHEFDEVNDSSDIVIVGPGPGDPRDVRNPKMKKLENVTAKLLQDKRSFLSVCLGHQKLCEMLGMPVETKEEVSQGTQREIDFFGEKERLGFYNTFAARRTDNIPETDICADPDTDEVFAVRGSHFSGYQFHPESIMSEHGFRLLGEELKRLLSLKNK